MTASGLIEQLRTFERGKAEEELLSIGASAAAALALASCYFDISSATGTRVLLCQLSDSSG